MNPSLGLLVLVILLLKAPQNGAEAEDHNTTFYDGLNTTNSTDESFEDSSKPVSGTPVSDSDSPSVSGSNSIPPVSEEDTTPLISDSDPNSTPPVSSSVPVSVPPPILPVSVPPPLSVPPPKPTTPSIKSTPLSKPTEPTEPTELAKPTEPTIPTEPAKKPISPSNVTTIPESHGVISSPEPPSNTTTTTEEDRLISPTVSATEHEPAISISIFLIFILLSICSILVHFMIKYKLKFLPESIVFVIIGFIVGILYNTVIPQITKQDLTFHEKFSPESFFLLLLPPIIFESGYSLHKGNFFQNIGSIILFAVMGTAVSTFIVGGGLVALSKLGVIYELTLVQGFSFGALISAVDPVATLAIFHALDVNPTLNMLVFGESVLNDAVAIVLTKTILQQSESDDSPGFILLKSLGNFLLMFVGSAMIGIVFALASALFLKYVNLRRVYSLEFAMWVIFAFGPYFFAEGIHLSGIMAVLFCGIVMSHYTHYNLSPVTQVTVQQTMRTVSFMAETVVFLYIGMQVFAIRTSFRVELIIWSLILILVGRAANIFPLSFLVNRFRSVKISSRMQFIMWFSGLRGAIAYALALNLVDQGSKFASKEVIEVLSTTTLVIVLFTIIFLGGSTLPLLKCLSKGSNGSDLTLSKTEDVGVAPANAEGQDTIIPELLSRERHQWFMILDLKYFKPFLIRMFTKKEVEDARIEMQRRTNEWYEGLRAMSSDEDNGPAGRSKMVGVNIMETSLRERIPSSSSGSSQDLTNVVMPHYPT